MSLPFPVLTNSARAQDFATERLAEGAILLVSKPVSWTSFDVVRKLKYLTRVKKVGHCGTLDPFAEGLLLICLGAATKLAGLLTNEDKVYTGTIELGTTTDTDDVDGTVLKHCDVEAFTPAEVHAAAATFVGELLQHHFIRQGGGRIGCLLGSSG